MRLNWDCVKAEAMQLAHQWKSATCFESKRLQRQKRFHEELSSDERLLDPEQRFQTEVYYRNIDILLTQLEVRFKAVHSINQLFRCISPKVLFDRESPSDATILKLADELVREYPEDISPSLGPQLLRFKMSFIKQMTAQNDVLDLLKLLLCRSQAASSFPDVITAGMLYLTLPVSVASAERSFSKLKLIKNYLRSTMSQTRLSALAVLCIERESAKQIDIDGVIDRFVEAKSRRQKF